MSQNGSALLQAGPNFFLDAIKRAAERQFDGSWEEMYKSGNHIQSRILDVVSRLMEPQSWAPRSMIKTALDLGRQSAKFFSYLDPHPEGKIAWDEFNNKLQAFSLFKFADTVINRAPQGHWSLPELVDRALQLGDYSSVWVIEGLGSYYADLQLKHGGLPDHLLSDVQSRMLPAAGVLPLHTGMGLVFAESVLQAMNDATPQPVLLDRLVALCRNNSQEGYWGAVFEALGLVARNLYPHLITSIDLHLRQNEELLAYFWHGIGRGLYFVPTNFFPFHSAPWRAFDMCLREPPHETGRHNTVAGLAWALTLVNIRQPEIVAAFLKHHEKDMGEGDAVANGICSAMMIWRDSSPNDRYLNALAQYQPDSFLTPLWQKFVKESSDLARTYYPVLKTQQRLGELFRYQNIHQLAGRQTG